MLVSMRPIAYIVPHARHYQAPFVRHELTAVEALGQTVLRYALHSPLLSTRRAWNEPDRPVGLRDGPPLAEAWRGLRTAWQRRRHIGPALRLLLRDMHEVGWFDRRAWALAGQWLAAARWAPMLEAAGCAHLHAHGLQAPTHLAMYAAAMTGIPFTATAHGHGGPHALLLAQKARRARMLLTATHAGRQALLARGVAPDRVEVVRGTLALLPDERPVIRAAAGQFHIGTSGRLSPGSGMDDLIEALALLVRGGCRPVRLYIAGEGPERLRLQVLVDRLGLQRQVDFLGRVPAGEFGRWMRTLDLFVMPTREHAAEAVEDIPSALMEAMGRGLPVVGTRLWATPELVLDGQTGLLVEPGDPPMLAERIGQAMREPARARALAHAARAHVRWEFGRERNLRRLVRHFGVSTPSPTRPVPLEEAA